MKRGFDVPYYGCLTYSMRSGSAANGQKHTEEYRNAVSKLHAVLVRYLYYSTVRLVVRYGTVDPCTVSPLRAAP